MKPVLAIIMLAALAMAASAEENSCPHLVRMDLARVAAFESALCEAEINIQHYRTNDTGLSINDIELDEKECLIKALAIAEKYKDLCTDSEKLVSISAHQYSTCLAMRQIALLRGYKQQYGHFNHIACIKYVIEEAGKASAKDSLRKK